MNLQQIEYVLKIAEERSFSKAAKKLFITQPSLSQIIAKLETQLGVQLFDRTTNPVQITQAGRIFIKHAREIITADELIKSEIAELSELKRGVLNIGTNPFMASCLLAPSMTKFVSEYNDIKINICEDTSENLEKFLMDGTVDFAVSTGRFDSNVFKCEHLVCDKLYLAVSEKNLINRNLTGYRIFADDIKNNSQRINDIQPVDVTVFRNQKFMFIKNDDTVEKINEKFISTFGFAPETSVYSNHIETLFSFVLSDIGIAFIPEIFIKFANIQYHPVYYSVDIPKSSIKLIEKSNRQLSDTANEYKNILMQFFH